MKKNTAAKLSLASLAVILGGGSVLMNTQPFTPVHAEVQDTKEAQDTTVMIDQGTSWKYLDDNTDPAAGGALNAWTLGAFDDSAWKEAAGKFGAKRGELADVSGYMPTVLLNQYYEENKDIPTYFFRTSVTLENISEITSLSGTFYSDDEAAVYINGHEVFSNLSAQPDGDNLYYSGHGQGAPEEHEISLSAEECQEYLVEGENVIAVELHNDRETSSDIYFEFESLNANRNEVFETVQKSVILMVGSDETSRNLTWYANVDTAGSVQWAKQSDMQDGLFPAQYNEAAATSIATNDEGFYSNQATMTNLEENTAYVYRVVNGDTVSQIYTFETGDFDEGFSFILAGDPQIGAGNTETDTVGWDETLDTAIAQLDPDFLVSAGDQVNTNNNETQYTGYLNDALTYLTSATTIGNHDSGSAAYNEHFNLPNESTQLGATTAGTDYWFVYDNTLFMVINSNNRSTAEHKEFLESAIAQNPDVRWKTVVFHHSVYSTASHVDDGDIIERREELPPMLSELDIDVVLMGHDHVYTRTYMMDGTTPDDSQGVQSEVTNPEGVLYLTANSASGSKYYDIKAPEAAYSAVMDQSYRRTITDIDVTDTSYTMTTYYMDTMEVLDTFTINKIDTDKSELEGLVEKAEQVSEADCTAEEWQALQSALEAAKSVLADEKATQDAVNEAYTALQSAYDAATTQDPADPGEDNGQGGDDTQDPADDQDPADEQKPADGDQVDTAAAAGASAAAAALILGAAGVAIAARRRKA